MPKGRNQKKNARQRRRRVKNAHTRKEQRDHFTYISSYFVTGASAKTNTSISTGVSLSGYTCWYRIILVMLTQSKMKHKSYQHMLDNFNCTREQLKHWYEGIKMKKVARIVQIDTRLPIRSEVDTEILTNSNLVAVFTYSIEKYSGHNEIHYVVMWYLDSNLWCTVLTDQLDCDCGYYDVCQCNTYTAKGFAPVLVSFPDLIQAYPLILPKIPQYLERVLTPTQNVYKVLAAYMRKYDDAVLLKQESNVTNTQRISHVEKLISSILPNVLKTIIIEYMAPSTEALELLKLL